MKIKINDEFKHDTLSFIKSLKKENSFGFFPAKEGLTKEGQSIDLGFSCLALKSFYILNEWEKLSQNEAKNWLDYINSFQVKNDNIFPDGSFVDLNYLKQISQFDFYKELKRLGKRALSKNYKTKKTEVDEYMRAETKQAISSIFQVGSKNSIKYKSQIFESNKLSSYLESLNWKTPWTSGAQFAGLSVFLETQELDGKKYLELKEQLITFSNKLVDKKTGCNLKKKVF